MARQLEQVITPLNTNPLVPWMPMGPASLDGLLKRNELLVEKALPTIGVTFQQFKPTLRRDLTTATWRST